MKILPCILVAAVAATGVTIPAQAQPLETFLRDLTHTFGNGHARRGWNDDDDDGYRGRRNWHDDDDDGWRGGRGRDDDDDNGGGRGRGGNDDDD